MSDQRRFAAFWAFLLGAASTAVGTYVTTVAGLWDWPPALVSPGLVVGVTVWSGLRLLGRP